MLMRSPDASSFIVASPHARSFKAGQQGRVSAITPDVSTWGFLFIVWDRCTVRKPLSCIMHRAACLLTRQLCSTSSASIQDRPVSSILGGLGRISGLCLRPAPRESSERLERGARGSESGGGGEL